MKNIRLSQKEAMERSSSVGAILIGKYLGGKQLCIFECPNCGISFERNPSQVWSEKAIWCSKCAHNHGGEVRSGQLKDDIIQKLVDKGAIIVSDYIRNEKLMTFKCPDCGILFERSSHIVLANKKFGGIYCIDCSRRRGGEQRRVLQEEWDRRFMEVGALSLEPVITDKTKIRFKCPKCEIEFKRAPNNVMTQKQAICWECSKIQGGKKLRLTQEEADKKTKHLLENGYKVFRIQSSGDDIPTREELEQGINYLLNGGESYILTMESWFKAEQKYVGMT